MKPFNIIPGDGPIILGQPHGGTFVPPEVWAGLNENGKQLADTDWHIGELYAGLLPSATVVAANFHRYVIDANRDPLGNSLYPGLNTTGLCPLTDFDGKPIYKDGFEPNVAQVLIEWHQPYHLALAAEIARVKTLHGFALVLDCHSIRNHIPYLFEGTLPDLNIGTDNGKTCAPTVEKIVADICKSSPFSSVLNGRFRGGWTTRYYGQPHNRVHAIQMEIVQSAYLETEAAPWRYSVSKAAKIQPILQDILSTLESSFHG
jgi:N-formylglutamate deformylase